MVGRGGGGGVVEVGVDGFVLLVFFEEGVYLVGWGG